MLLLRKKSGGYKATSLGKGGKRCKEGK